MSRYRFALAVLPVCLISALALTLGHPFARNSPKRGFYYWKTEWSGSSAILRTLSLGHIDRLYIRFFDLAWNDDAFEAQPVAPLRFEAAPPSGVEIVPVVYITNAVFLKIAYSDVEPLAERVWTKVSRMASARGVVFDELQIDCDWSDGSQRNYFHFVDLLSRRLHAEHRIVSSTIRLHQVKYVQRTGIPPAARGMLMFYNFGRIEADNPRSSIFNTADASRYSSFIAAYPLTLDVVLPAFSWSIHSRDGQVLGLLEHVTADDVASFEGFGRLATNRYTATRSFFFRGRYFVAGDRLLMETTTPGLTREAALLAKRGAGRHRTYGTVALFDLNETLSNIYSGAELETILAAF
jgi:hypothetical protein